MTDPAATSGLRRILGAYDAMTSDEPSLQALAELAMQLQAELELLFVEDMDLVRAAGLPLARQINLRTGAAGPLSLNELEVEMRATGARLRRRLADAAARRHIRWSFRTVRGEAVHEVLLASEAVDLLVLRHQRSWAGRQPAMPGPAAVARQAHPSVLLLEHGAEAPRSVAVRLAAAGDNSLDILVSNSEQIRTVMEQADAMTRSGKSAPRIQCQVSRPAKDDALSDAMGRAQRGLLVIGADDPVLQGANVWDRLVAAACSVLVVRS